MSFAKDMLSIKNELESRGHTVILPEGTASHAEGNILEEDKWRKLEIDPLKVYFEEIKHSDAILVLNIEKTDVKGYIGGNTLIEMAFAYVLNKKIFLLNPIPQISYEDEIFAMKPIVINSDLDLVR